MKTRLALTPTVPLVTLAALAMLLLTCSTSVAQQFTEQISKQFSKEFSKQLARQSPKAETSSLAGCKKRKDLDLFVQYNIDEYQQLDISCQEAEKYVFAHLGVYCSVCAKEKKMAGCYSYGMQYYRNHAFCTAGSENTFHIPSLSSLFSQR